MYIEYLTQMRNFASWMQTEVSRIECRRDLLMLWSYLFLRNINSWNYTGMATLFNVCLYRLTHKYICVADCSCVCIRTYTRVYKNTNTITYICRYVYISHVSHHLRFILRMLTLLLSWIMMLSCPFLIHNMIYIHWVI